MTTTNRQALQLAAAQLVKAQDKVSEIIVNGDPYNARCANLHNTLNSLGTALEAAGATYQPTDRPAVDPDGLEALRKVEGSRQEAEGLLHWLKGTLPRAEALDYQRGNWVGDMAHTDQGETPGTDFAEKVQALVLRLEMELGVEGGGRE